MNGVLTLIGAGELMPAMSRAHREALALVPPPVRAVYIDTTAGFETNADAITDKAVDYYAHRLQTELRVASYRHAQRATDAELARAIAEVRAANFIFAGPGSPTYALEHWRGSPLWAAVLERFHQGAHLLFASAASIVLGRYALPVYEIFKTGRDPYWEEGLDLLGALGLNLAVVPHFNDNSGGENYDSRFCYMGARRFEELQARLPPDVAIMGIDEYTAARFDPDQGTASVTGQGSVTVIADGARVSYAPGSAIPLETMHSSRRIVVPADAHASFGYEYAAANQASGRLDVLADYVAALPLDGAMRLELLSRVEAATAHAQPAGPAVDEAGLVDLALELRSALRAARRWDLADLARDALVRLGYEIQDTPDGTRWRRQEGEGRREKGEGERRA
ncbi:MAG: hypothetical protein HYY05_01830 [Chloroflexi bacterium]|nr:hypothetical protein [Chloroflexota bacterium]